jgi:hypothetical protein
MRFIKLFLVGYAVLVLGITLALGQTGVLARAAPLWLVTGALLTIGIGIMLPVSSGKPAMAQEVRR